ncbi:hypothetical protein [uncultured Methanolobus sp.]|uniref:hypothetical protein n=1 Tax=uncultured Methanolobus sp. TaxID=218300 RepID=UPI0029C7EE98|nr:hypothetical protein [uncultured Methanolobus sp.]
MDFRLIFIIGFVGFVVTVILLAIIFTLLNEKKRSKNLNEQARRLGFQPASKGIVTSMNFKQIKLGNKQKLYNVFTGTFNGLSIISFDLNITIGNLGYGTGTSHGNTFKSSGIIFKKNAPIFKLQPLSTLSINGYNELFSLEGDSLFMDETFAQCVGKNYAIESNGTHVLFVPSRKRVVNINKEIIAAYEILQGIVQNSKYIFNSNPDIDV